MIGAISNITKHSTPFPQTGKILPIIRQQEARRKTNTLAIIALNNPALHLEVKGKGGSRSNRLLQLHLHQETIKKGPSTSHHGDPNQHYYTTQEFHKVSTTRKDPQASDMSS